MYRNNAEITYTLRCIWVVITQSKWHLSQVNEVCLNIRKPINVFSRINRIKDTNYINISIDEKQKGI